MKWSGIHEMGLFKALDRCLFFGSKGRSSTKRRNWGNNPNRRWVAPDREAAFLLGKNEGRREALEGGGDCQPNKKSLLTS